MYLSLGTWTVRKYNLHVIIYDLNLTHCLQNSDDRLNFFSLSLSETSIRKIDPFVILILTEYLILLEDLELRETKSSEIPIQRICLKITSRGRIIVKKKSQQLDNLKIRQLSSKLLLSTMLLDRYIVYTYIDSDGLLNILIIEHREYCSIYLSLSVISIVRYARHRVS